MGEEQLSRVFKTGQVELLRRGALWVPIEVRTKGSRRVIDPLMSGEFTSSLTPFFNFRTKNFDSRKLPMEHHLSFEYVWPTQGDTSITIQLYDPSFVMLQEQLRREWNEGDRTMIIEYGWVTSAAQKSVKTWFPHGRISNFLIASLYSIDYEYGRFGPTLTIRAVPNSFRLFSRPLDTREFSKIPKVPAHDPQFSRMFANTINSLYKRAGVTSIRFAVEYIGYPTQPVDLAAAESVDGSQDLISFLKWVIDAGLIPGPQDIRSRTTGRGGSRYAVSIPQQPDPALSALNGVPTYKIYFIDKLYAEERYSTDFIILFNWPSPESPFGDVNFTFSNPVYIYDSYSSMEYVWVDEDGNLRKVSGVRYKDIAGHRSDSPKEKQATDVTGGNPTGATSRTSESKALATASFPMIGDPLFDLSVMPYQTVYVTSPSIAMDGKFADRNFWSNFKQLRSKAGLPPINKIPMERNPFEGYYTMMSVVHNITNGKYSTTFELHWSSPPDVGSSARV